MPHYINLFSSGCSLTVCYNVSSSGSPDFMQNTLPVVISGVHMFLPLGMSVSGDVDWHFLLQFL